MRLLLAESRSDVRLGIEMLLNQVPDVRVVGTASDVAGLLALMKTSNPDIAIIDWGLPGEQSIYNLLPGIKEANRATKIIVLCIHPDVESDAGSVGADAFISKTDPPDKLLNVLRTICTGIGFE